MRTKLLNRNTVLSSWNDKAVIDDEFPRTFNNFFAQPYKLVEYKAAASLT